MNFKKKFSILLLVLLFIMVLGTFSTCYANVTTGYVTYLMESIRDNATFLNNSATNKSYVTNFMSDSNNISTLVNELNTRLLNHNWSALNDYNMFATFQTSSSNIKIKFCFSNCTVPNNVSDVGYTQFRGNYFGPYNNERNLIVYLTLNNTATYSEYWTTGTSEYYDYIEKISNNDYTIVQFTNVYNYSPVQVVYSTNAYNQLTGQFLNDSRGTYQNNLPVTPTPTPLPTPEPTPTPTPEPAQVIISKMDDINNNISTQGQNIVNAISGEGLAIRETISGEAQKLHDDLTSYDLDEQSNNVNNLISSMQSSVSGEMTNNEIFRMLDSAEQGFFGLITGEADDFIISWDDVIYENSVIIPAGSINFHQLCRDNQALGQVKFYLNIILSALLGFALLKYLYNLFLATLGIDNQYVYEKNIDSGNISPKVTDSTKHGGNSYDKNGNINGWGRM